MNPGYQPPQGFVTEAELSQAPMEEFHKDLAILHFHRLKRVLAEDDDDAIARYTNKDAAREQLARMTLVIRDHVAHRARGEIEENAIESMIIDVVDASFFASGKERTFTQPILANPLPAGREHEVAALMQEVSAGNVDDVIELWNAPRFGHHKVVPEPDPVLNIGSDIEWHNILRRAISEDDITHYFKHVETYSPAKQERTRKRLMKPIESRNTLVWPPAPHEISAMLSQRRARSGTESSTSSELYWEFSSDRRWILHVSGFLS